MLKAADVACFFIDIANRSEEGSMTNLQLNKLLYYAQGCSIQRTGMPLFPEVIEAWKHGPVVSDVYHTYKVCGKNPIESTGSADQTAEMSAETRDLLIDVYREYGK